VFVDYNDAGVMKRLPVTGATASAGTVTKVPNNDKGVWVVGNARTNSSFSAIVQLLTAVKNVGGACVYASNYPPVGEYLSATEITFTGTPMYEILLTKPGGGSTTVKSGGTFLLPCDYTVTSFTDATGAPGTITGEIPGIPGIHQPQGSCTYTEPAVVGTFAGFDKNYGAATYTSLIDERDNKIYPVVKIGGRWIMARNLNYQENLTWQTYANKPNTNNPCTECIGSFWCPGTNGATTSTMVACEVYGALYSWETAMLLDGYGTWTEVATYSTGAANTANAKFNQGRPAHSGTGTGGRGICPPNWHVPTDFEWSVIFDAMEGSNSTVHQNASGYTWFGTNAGKYAKAKCTCASGNCSSDTDPSWTYHASANGTDLYGFRALPAGRRNSGSYSSEGTIVHWCVSSAINKSETFHREFNYSRNDVSHGNINRSTGLSVRCIRDE
jgi:uncharacterized protein (TIGR02145 family)